MREDKYELEPEYISANGDWGVQDPVTGLWNGVVFHVQHLSTVSDSGTQTANF